MIEPYLHPQTGKDLKNYLLHPSHAILIFGAESSGKGHIAEYIAEKLLGVGNKDVGLARYDGESMGIDDVRQLLKQLKLTLPGEYFSRRVIIIEHIEKLGHEAQNSLLKTLEQPPKNTTFIGTTSEYNLVLPTVVSRMSLLQIRPLPLEEVKEIFAGRYSDSEITRAYHISEGSASLLLSILEGGEHKLADAINWAKEVIRSNAYQRLLLVDDLCKNQADNLDTYLFAIQKVLRASVQHSKLTSRSESMKRVDQLDITLKARENLQANVSPKLVLTSLFVSL